MRWQRCYIKICFPNTAHAETKLLSFLRYFCHWLHRKLSKWQLSVQPVTKMSSKWRHFHSTCSSERVTKCDHLTLVLQSACCPLRTQQYNIQMYIWVRSRNCGCLVTWFCYQLIAKPGNKTAANSWPDPYINIAIPETTTLIRFSTTQKTPVIFNGDVVTPVDFWSQNGLLQPRWQQISSLARNQIW